MKSVPDRFITGRKSRAGNGGGMGAEAIDASGRPYLANVGVIAFVPDEWEIPWQPRHQILIRLARYFNVVWCTPAPWWRDLWNHYGTNRLTFAPDAPIPPGLTIYRPEKWLPEVGRPRFLARWTQQKRLRQAQAYLSARGCRITILNIWQPSYSSILDNVKHDLSYYHIDDEYSFSDVERPIDTREARLISRVDQVFIHSPGLMEKKSMLNPRVLFTPNGVDYGAYSKPYDEPADLKPIPHPRVGYVGRIKRQLDLALLLALARRHRHWSFVLVGPLSCLGEREALVKELAEIPNVHLLGCKPVTQLPAYTQHLDVGMLCYEVNDYTKFIYPQKLHEYLATGLPVVGAPIRSLLDYGHIIRLARTTDEWSQFISESLVPAARTAEIVEARRSVARRHDWNKLVEKIARTLCNRLGPEYSERFEKIPPVE
jgi:glycosyltransferase involved in cell wall biosynthesis